MAMAVKQNFEKIGAPVSFGDVYISDDHAEEFRKIALQGTRIKSLQLTDTRTEIMTTSYASGVLSDAAADYDVYETAYYAKSVRESNPDFWRSVITFARYNQKNADTKIYNVFSVESINGSVEHATREVRIIRNLSRIAFDGNGEPIVDTYSRQYKAFEQPLMEGHIDHIATSVDRIMRRQAATRPHY